MIAFIIFAHCTEQNVDDVNDMIYNIKYFHKDCEIFINHPNIQHEKIKTRHTLGQLNNSSFIFGAFIDIIKTLTFDEIERFDHFVLVSANQYFISEMKLEKNVNYVQFYNVEDWEYKYTGKDFRTDYEGFPLKQFYGLWDPKEMYKIFGIETPMASNWESACLTKESMRLCKENIDIAINTYPNCDLISTFPGFMALKSGQKWKFPPFFGTFDPSNPKPKNWILTEEQECLLEKINLNIGR